MADEPNGLQSEGRNDNAAQPLNASDNKQGGERYPSVDQHDAVERTGRDEAVAGASRSFEPRIRNETAPEGDASTDGDDVPPSANEGRLGPGGDPVEGKR
ncbi:MAG TPA: hypothetical protein VIO94_10440 [Phenylobacterium sp.]